MPRQALRRSRSAQRSLPTLTKDVIKAAATTMTCSLLAPAVPAQRLGESPMENDHRLFCEALHRHRLKAIGVMIKHRPAVAAAMEAKGIDSSALFEIEFFTDWSDEVQARERARSFERIYVACARLLTVLHAKLKVRPETLPLTEIQQEIMGCLAGKALFSKEIRRLLPSLPSDEAVRKHVQAIRARGHEVQAIPGQGYVRPDAPPV